MLASTTTAGLYIVNITSSLESMCGYRAGRDVIDSFQSGRMAFRCQGREYHKGSIFGDLGIPAGDQLRVRNVPVGIRVVGVRQAHAP